MKGLKVLVWVIALVVASIIMVAIERLSSIKLGALVKLLIVGSAVFVARLICKKITEKNKDKQEGEEND